MKTATDREKRSRALEKSGWKKGFISTWSHAGYAVRNLTLKQAEAYQWLQAVKLK